MRIAYVTDEIPRPNRAGYLAYNHALVSHLAARGHDITLVLGHPRLNGLAERFDDVLDTARVRVVGQGLRAAGGRVAPARPAGMARAAARRLIERLPGGLGESLRARGRAGEYGSVDAVIGRFLTDAEARTAAAFAADADLVLADAIFRAPVLDHVDGRAARGIVTHDVFHLRHAALAARGLRLHPAQLTREDEAARLQRAALLVAIQDHEAETLRTLAPHAHVVTAPMPARPVARPPGLRREPWRLVFVGSVAPHNVDGMRWFLAEVWPRLLAAQPGMRLDICGSVGRALAPVPAGVVLHDIVADLAPLLHRASLGVAPLRAGSGLKIKMLDFAAHGLVCVTTAVGADGYDQAADRPFVIADDAESFAAAILALAGDDAARREAEAQAYVRRYAAGTLLAPFVAAVEKSVQ